MNLKCIYFKKINRRQSKVWSSIVYEYSIHKQPYLGIKRVTLIINRISQVYKVCKLYKIHFNNEMGSNYKHFMLYCESSLIIKRNHIETAEKNKSYCSKSTSSTDKVVIF